MPKMIRQCRRDVAPPLDRHATGRRCGLSGGDAHGSPAVGQDDAGSGTLRRLPLPLPRGPGSAIARGGGSTELSHAGEPPDPRRDPARSGAALLHPGSRRCGRRPRALHPDRLTEPSSDGIGVPDPGRAHGGSPPVSAVAFGVAPKSSDRPAEPRPRRGNTAAREPATAQGALGDASRRLLSTHP